MYSVIDHFCKSIYVCIKFNLMCLWNQSHLWWDMDSGLEPTQTLGQWELLGTLPLEWSLKQMKVQLFKEWRTWKCPLKICFRDKIFGSGTVEVFILLGYDVTSLVDWCPTFGENVDIWPLEMRPLHCCRTSDTIHPVTRHHIPEKWRLHDFYT